MTTSVLPTNATPLESALDLAGAARFASLGDGAGAIAGWRWVNPQPPLMPFLVWEFGLGALSPYVPNLYNLVAEGLQWERLRGSHAALAMALGFIGYAGSVVDPAARSRAWADYQIALDRVRDAEGDLPRIDGLARLSQPVRSHFRRGVHGYDVPAAETSWTLLSGAVLSDDSGVRPDPDGPKWSFGRAYEGDLTLTEAELTAVEAWIPGVAEGGVTWDDLTLPWTSVTSSWEDLGSGGARARTMAAILEGRGAYVGFYDGGGALIGARRCRALRRVQPGGSTYQILGGSWDPNGSGEALYVEALTDFGDGNGEVAAEAAVLFGAAPSDPSRPGQRWCDPGEITAPYPAVARHPVSIEFGATVRERVSLILRVT